ncbi:MAG: prephenate dehydrogenase [Actinomycetota bacterium]|nr:prephenate dehydrogenase [Actinomycetota bacterium]
MSGPLRGAHHDTAPETVLVVGTGLVGTSAALALRAAGAQVYLEDADPAHARRAAQLGAGIAGAPPGPVEVCLLGVPPEVVAPTLAALQSRGIARHYTDVASIKAAPQHAAESLACDTASYVGGHPMAGRERSGPSAARSDLFVGRPWILTPSAATSPDTVAAARSVALACGALPVVLTPEEHDRAVALVSHAPHVVAAAVAARLLGGEDEAVGLAGQGVRDVTRIAASDPTLWQAILRGNAAPVAEVVAAVAEDLAAVARSLRALAEGSADDADETVRDLLERGVAGRARIPGKHGGPPATYLTVPVVVEDRPGELARLFVDAGRAGVNVEDVRIEHSPGQPVGLVELLVRPEAAAGLAAALDGMGWRMQG